MRLVLIHIGVDPSAGIRGQPSADGLLKILGAITNDPAATVPDLRAEIENAHNAGVPHDTIIAILGEIAKTPRWSSLSDYCHNSMQSRMAQLGFSCATIGKLYPGYHSSGCHLGTRPGTIGLPEFGPDESGTVVYPSGCRTTFEEALKDHGRDCLTPEAWEAYVRPLHEDERRRHKLYVEELIAHLRISVDPDASEEARKKSYGILSCNTGGYRQWTYPPPK
jgi:hypothetical protein